MMNACSLLSGKDGAPMNNIELIKAEHAESNRCIFCGSIGIYYHRLKTYSYLPELTDKKVYLCDSCIEEFAKEAKKALKNK